MLLLNTRRRIRGHHLVSIGTLDTILVHPREVFRVAVMASAAAIVLMHNLCAVSGFRHVHGCASWGERTGVDSPEPIPANSSDLRVRTLKIEKDGDFFKGRIKPKIRLMGRWLEQAGFKPGARVSVACTAPGVIELRSDATPQDGAAPQVSDEIEPLA